MLSVYKEPEVRYKDNVYVPDLNRLVDHLFKEAADQKWSWTRLAEESGLAYSTVKKLGNYETRYPQFRTVQLLAKALGGSVEFTMSPQATRRTKWNPDVLNGRYAG